MRHWVIAASFCLAACASAAGAPNAPAPFTAQAPAAAAATADYPIAVDAPAGEYRLDPRHANVTWRIRHMGLSWFTARFDARDATLNFDPADPTRSTLRATVDVNSVNTGVLNARGERAFDAQIGRLLGGEANPQITFTSTSLVRTGQFTGRMTGDLAMNGQTHPATLDVTFDGAVVDPLRAGTVLGFSAHGTIDRKQWGQTQWSEFVADEIQIVIEAEFVKA